MPATPTIRGMHLRRALLLFALVLGLSALAAAVSPMRDTKEPVAGPAPAATPAQFLPRTIAFEARSPGTPAVERARTGEHLVLSVASAVGGLVTIPELGRTESVSPSAPARFDVLAPPAGRYDVLLTASGGAEPRRVGTLVTRR